MDSIPADIQRKVEDLQHQILDRIGFGSYSEALNFASGIGGGRIKAMLWQAIFQHLLVRRRGLCQRAAQDFYGVEKKAESAVKRLKSGSQQLDWLLVYTWTHCLLEPGSAQNATWLYAKNAITSWGKHETQDVAE